MFGIRQKLLFGFGGLFAVLLFASGIGIHVIKGVSTSFQKIFRENLETVTACEKMRSALESLNENILVSLWEDHGVDTAAAAAAVRTFDSSLRFQQGNVTVPGEQELTDRLTAAWQAYRQRYPAALDLHATLAARRARYQASVLGTYRDIEGLTRRIAELNMQNILSADGQVKHRALAASKALYALLLAGLGLILAVILITATLILKPMRTLTRSVQEIEKGNLDLVLEVRSRDEMGQLAAAFNAMAARLREFRRTDQARLVRIQQTTQTAINSLPDAVAILDAGGMVEITNPAAADLFGIKTGTRVESLGIPWLREMFQRVVRDQRPIIPKGYESAIQIFRDGREGFFLPQVIPVLDAGRGFNGVTLVLVDVTELRRLDETKSDLLATVSHELKTLLTSVRMALHLLLDEKVGDLNPKQAELVLAAREDADRLHRIIEGLLDIGRIQAGRLDMDLKPLAVPNLVQPAVDAVHAAYQKKGVTLRTDIPGDLPAVLADSTRVHLILGNLLGNALRYTHAGGEVCIAAEPRDQHVRFQVTDTGTGIPVEYLPRVFERFFRVPEPGHPAGAGLGLAIVKEIVLAHGGEVGVESKVGEGSTFSFTLRAAPAEAKRAPGAGILETAETKTSQTTSQGTKHA